jgi:putative intracellular protease/amidase
MNRSWITLLIFIALAACSTSDMGQSSSQVLLIPREGVYENIDLTLSKEVGVMTSMLEKAGFKVVVATVACEAIKGSSTTLMPNLKLSDVKVADYAGFILPCMAVGGYPGPRVAPAAVEIVKQALKNGKPVAAQYGSVYILAEAGVLVGKRYAFPADALTLSPPGCYKDTRFTGAIYAGKGVVQDGNIITSGYCPSSSAEKDCTTELTQTFIAALGQKK